MTEGTSNTAVFVLKKESVPKELMVISFMVNGLRCLIYGVLRMVYRFVMCGVYGTWRMKLHLYSMCFKYINVYSC